MSDFVFFSFLQFDAYFPFFCSKLINKRRDREKRSERQKTPTERELVLIKEKKRDSVSRDL